MWARKRDEKLLQQRQEREAADAALPFAPVLASPSASLNARRQSPEKKFQQHDAGIYGGSGRAWGYDEFVDRQEEARRRQEERQRLADRVGAVEYKADQPRSTRAVAPQLGMHQVEIAALQQPVAPPGFGSGGYSPEDLPASSSHRKKYLSDRGEYPTPPSQQQHQQQSPSASNRYDAQKPTIKTEISKDMEASKWFFLAIACLIEVSIMSIMYFEAVYKSKQKQEKKMLQKLMQRNPAAKEAIIKVITVYEAEETNWIDAHLVTSSFPLPLLPNNTNNTPIKQAQNGPIGFTFGKGGGGFRRS